MGKGAYEGDHGEGDGEIAEHAESHPYLGRLMSTHCTDNVGRATMI